MSHNSSSRKKPSQGGRFKSRDGQGKKKRSSNLPQRRQDSFSSRGSGRGSGGRGKRPVLQFDPSLFMKKVEEQTAAQAYVPQHKFSDFAITDQLKANIEKKGYVAPTPIQDQAIPHILEGRDVVGTANTGTGKTAAFLIPLIHAAMTNPASRVLIIAPTRELAIQIRDEFKSFTMGTNLASTLCIGGANITFQMQSLRKKPAFVIGTPGRLIDLEENKAIHFGHYTSIVLDEVDRMLDMGFIKDISSIINKLPKQRHSLFFSATLSPEVQKVMQSFLKDPVAISVKTRQSAENVNQDIIKVGDQNKIDLLHDLLIKPAFNKVLIFLRTKRTVDKLAKELTARGFSVAFMHGDRSQSQRSKALLAFKTGQVAILLATDVVARGIDIDDISHVINFDLPQTYEDYIHRIGRTGRADKVGQAITFV
ncbi:MAG TPA: DEAD/DEAH box helicase [Candidatus Babeliales bacterium]|nr:DEAD/DEAH box helicase [Candidatus Babeliales bacterium]